MNFAEPNLLLAPELMEIDLLILLVADNLQMVSLLGILVLEEFVADSIDSLELIADKILIDSRNE